MASKIFFPKSSSGLKSDPIELVGEFTRDLDLIFQTIFTPSFLEFLEKTSVGSNVFILPGLEIVLCT